MENNYNRSHLVSIMEEEILKDKIIPCRLVLAAKNSAFEDDVSFNLMGQIIKEKSPFNKIKLMKRLKTHLKNNYGYNDE